jgi:hypothetical protein
MSNQRPAKTHRAAMPNEGGLNITRLKEFAREAERLLEDQGETDAAFYFGQLAEYIQRHPEKGLSESVSRILGL